MKKLQKGNPITEMVKGSLEYTMNLITAAFRAQFGPNSYSSEAGPWRTIADTFADYVIVSEWGSATKLKNDEYYRVTYTRDGEQFTFASMDQWEVVELAYQPQTKVVESGKKKKGQRFEERINAGVVLLEKEEGKARRIKIDGAIQAGVVNGNGRRYPSQVLEAAVAELSSHLNESAGQGRAIQVLGEAEHPSDKGGRPNLLETVVKWEEVAFDGANVDITGRLLETSKGKDILTLMEGDVMPGVSLRGYGEGKTIKQGSDKIFEVSELHLTGFDLVLEPSFENTAQLTESQNQSSEDDMNLEELLKLLRENPDAFRGITEAQIKEMGETQLKALEARVRTALGIDGNADIAEALKATTEKARQFEESQKQSTITAAVADATKSLPYGETLNKIFVESFDGMGFQNADQVKTFAENQHKHFSQLAAAGVLKGMGFDEKTKRVTVIGDVLETETGTPEFGRVAFEITESVRKHDNRAKRALVERAESPAAVFTEQLLERFDKMYQRHLMTEAHQFEEAELTTDLNLPYSVSRAVIAEAFPNLVAANIFDVGIMENSPTKIFYEAFSGETGYEVAVTDEVETAGAEDTWYDLANRNIVPGTVTVTSNPAGTTYVEGTDYVIDYELGKIKALTAGAIDANDVLVSYTYHATRKGENAEIERGKTTLSSQTIEAIAYRLADYITHEAIVFSRSQLGWDAVARTMASLINQVRRDIDRGLIEKGVAAALSVASNTTAAWDISDAVYATLVALIGQAKVKVLKRFYQPTSILMSVTNADYLSNWDGFKSDGFPNALLNAAGFAGAVKGLPVFNSTEMRDTWNLVSNRELVLHRVYLPMTVKGPFPTYSNGKLVAAEQYYAEEYNASLAPIGGKGALVPTQA
jgi:hypothetical protein